MSIYRFDPGALPDSEFEPGRLEHLFPGNRGRLLDPRRTPVLVVSVRPRTGIFVVRLEAFEDEGALWEMPLEKVDRFQFARASAAAPPAAVEDLRQAARRFSRALVIPADPAAAAATARRLGALVERAEAWLRAGSTFLAGGGALPDPAGRRGDERLQEDLARFMNESGLVEMEQAFAQRYVSNPGSGDLVRGHRIVLAELGLVAYDGTVTRDPEVFAGPWSRARRARHILGRLAFLRAVFAALGVERVTLYRGVSTDSGYQAPRNETFVSASFSMDVARSHFESAGPSSDGALLRQQVPVDRLFMTHLETAAMNRQFLEAEAVLLFDERSASF